MKAVLRFERDKRGYEYFSLVQPASQRHGWAPTRLLYWFRTPPGVRVGRSPFDPAMQRAIEAQYPDMVFDWPRLAAAPVPSPSAAPERWRERRAAERAARAARAALRVDRRVDEPITGQAPVNEQAPTGLQSQDGEHIAGDPESRMMPASRRRRRRRRRSRPDSGEV